MRNLQAAADCDAVVHEMRSAPRLLHAPDADLIGVELRRGAQQRIGVLVDAFRALHDHDDVRAAGERRQAAAAGGCEPEMLDQRGDLFDPDDFDGEGLRVVHRKTSWTAGSSPGTSASTMTPI